MSTKKKILIAYATAGIGHKKASLAINGALEGLGLDADIKLIDVLDYTQPFFKKLYPCIYLLLIRRLIYLWGFLYYLLDFKIVYLLSGPFRRALHLLNSARLSKFILEYKPDVIVSTHFLLPDVCENLKKRHNLKCHLINVITDYRAHSFWISPAVDTYVVGHKKVSDELVAKWGILEDKIKVLGIPVEQKFSILQDKALLRKEMRIASDAFVAMFLSGGYGVGPLIRMLEALNTVDFSLTAITICGHNKRLHNKVEAFKKNAKINVINFGFVDNIDRLMCVSDICIGKPGGISITEALAQNLPFIFVRPIPGQERGNVNLLAKAGTGILLKKITNILTIIKDLRCSAEKINTMKERIRRIRKPNAAADIALYVKTLLKEE